METKRNNQNPCDFIIVGQGIAGSVLSISLINAGYSICMIDQSDLSSCSKVAAGIWNPVVFKRLTKSWLADEVITQLFPFYTHFETKTKSRFLYERNIIKPFTEEQEMNLWLKKAQNDNQFLEPHIHEGLKISASQTLGNYSHVLHAGNIDVVKFLEKTKAYILQTQTYLAEKFDFNDFKIIDDYLSYKSIKAKNIIFCEGHLISGNPYFNWIPMKPAKGEVLTIKCNDLNLEKDILNKGIFMMPLGDGAYKVGATYEWENLNDLPTEKGKKELEEKVASIIKVPFTVTQHEAGVRPAVIDRRPVIGKHPQHQNLFCFNGFGTKAVMLAPYFAKYFIDLFENKIKVNPEVEPTRFTSKT